MTSAKRLGPRLRRNVDQQQSSVLRRISFICCRRSERGLTEHVEHVTGESQLAAGFGMPRRGRSNDTGEQAQDHGQA